MRTTHTDSARRWAGAAALLLGVTASADWPQSRGDAANGAFVELEAPQSPPARAWTFDGTGRVLGYEPGMTVWSPAALGVVDGRAMLWVGGYDRFVWALDAALGEVLWKYATGDGVFAAPIFWDDGPSPLVFVASNDREVYALEAGSGRRRWSTALEAYRPTLGGARLSSPCLGRAGGEVRLFVGWWVFDRSLGASLQRGAVSALDARTGKIRWTRTLGDNEMTAPICFESAGRPRIALGSNDGNLHVLDADTGQSLWKHTEHDGIASAPAFVALDDGRALIVTGSRYGEVRALDAEDGTERWRLKTADRITGSPAGARIDGRVLIFVPSYDRHLYALDALTGAVVWRAPARGGFYNSPAVALTPNPVVLASAWDHSLHGIDARTGAERFFFFTGVPLWDVGGLDASTWSSPVAATINGVAVAFAGSYDGKLRGMPLETLMGRRSDRPSAIGFWVSLPLTVLPIIGLALWLTRRHRRARARA
jgi:outer membrane protein assembly factor BamB